MITESEIVKKVRKIEIRAKGLSRQLFSGEYHSAFKGRGMAFSEVREYQYGDDVRSIDWNVTARLNHPYVKIFEEERELTVMLLVDVSGSNRFGTRQQFKQELVAEVAATLAFSAIANNDKVGVIFFSDKIEKFITPKKGSTHILRIIRELITFEPQSHGTDLAAALQYFSNVIKKRSTCFVLSDFNDNDGNYEDALKIASKKHDLSALRITDRREHELPDIGLVKLHDNESGIEQWVDTSSAIVRQNYARQQRLRETAVDAMLKKYGIDQVTMETGDDFVKPLIHLFKMRQ
jgi:uncharacterized protein (DUF58 family)